MGQPTGDGLNSGAPEATFYTVSDAGYWPGTASMLNSLRRAGVTAPVVVLDRGLMAGQTTRLEREARVVNVEVDSSVYLVKPFARFLEPRGVVVLIDGDIIVNLDFDDVVERASSGKVCLYPDRDEKRFFEEWAEVFDLRAPLRRRPYLNAGLIAFSVQHHPGLLDRWWDLCQRISPDHLYKQGHPLAWADQDALNALLMSEVADEAIEVLPAEESPVWRQMGEVRIADRHEVRSEFRDRPTRMLHHIGIPKPWETRSWNKLRRNAYVRLMPELLFEDRNPIVLERSEVPLWLRGTLFGDVAMRALAALGRSLFEISVRIVRPLRRRLPEGIAA